MAFLALGQVQVRHVEHEARDPALVVYAFDFYSSIARRLRPGLRGHRNELARLVTNGAGLLSRDKKMALREPL